MNDQLTFSRDDNNWNQLTFYLPSQLFHAIINPNKLHRNAHSRAHSVKSLKNDIAPFNQIINS